MEKKVHGSFGRQARKGMLYILPAISVKICESNVCEIVAVFQHLFVLFVLHT
jgi:hypothetical protein